MDTTPANLFDSYEQDFQHLLQDIRDKLEGDGKGQLGEQRKAALRRVEIELDDADDIVSQMEMEIQGIPQSIKPQYAPRLKAAKAELTRCKKLSKDLHNALSRTDLLGAAANRFKSTGGTPTSDNPYDEGSDRTRLLAGTEVLGDGSRRLTDSTRVALETENEGADILRNLRSQREQIEHTRDTLRTADTSIDRASGTIKTMIRQMYKQRVIIGGIVVVLVALIAIILWFKLSRR